MLLNHLSMEEEEAGIFIKYVILRGEDAANKTISDK